MAKDFFTKLDCQALREEINRALAPVATKNGIKLQLGNMSYSSTEIRMKLDAVLLGEGGENLNDKNNFETYARMYGLEPSDYGKKFTTSKGEYTISGINTKKRKYPIVAKNNAGVAYIFESERVVELLKKSKV